MKTLLAWDTPSQMRNIFLNPSLVVSLLKSGKSEVLLRIAKEAEEKRRLYEM